MNSRQRNTIGYGVGIVAVLAVFVWLATADSRGRRVAVVAASVCSGLPASNAAPLDTTRREVHLLAEGARPMGEWAAWSYSLEDRWRAQRVSELELALCFSAESVVVDTCRGYTTAGGWAASDVVLAKRRWTLRLLEARTAQAIDSLRVEAPSGCPEHVGESVTYAFVDVEWQDGHVALWDWLAPFVEPGLPGVRARRACDGGDLMECANLGSMYAIGRGVPQSDRRAVGFYERACDGGKAGACARLGQLYDAGRAAPRDARRAAEVYRRACGGGDAKACESLRRVSVGPGS